jgi:hypothetical protein
MDHTALALQETTNSALDGSSAERAASHLLEPAAALVCNRFVIVAPGVPAIMVLWSQFWITFKALLTWLCSIATSD